MTLLSNDVSGHQESSLQITLHIPLSESEASTRCLVDFLSCREVSEIFAKVLTETVGQSALLLLLTR